MSTVKNDTWYPNNGRAPMQNTMDQLVETKHIVVIHEVYDIFFDLRMYLTLNDS